VEVVQAQTARLIHMCALVGTYESYVRLCELLNEITPGDGPKKSILANIGAESVENAVKLARAYPGRTLLTLSLTSKHALFKKKFGPYASEIVRLPMPNLYRVPEGMTPDQYVDWGMRHL